MAYLELKVACVFSLVNFFFFFQILIVFTTGSAFLRTLFGLNAARKLPVYARFVILKTL